MNFMLNLFLIGAVSGEPAGRLSRVKRSRWFILAGAIAAAALMAVLLAPMGQKMFRGGRRKTTGAGAGRGGAVLSERPGRIVTND